MKGVLFCHNGIIDRKNLWQEIAPRRQTAKEGERSKNSTQDGQGYRAPKGQHCKSLALFYQGSQHDSPAQKDDQREQGYPNHFSPGGRTAAKNKDEENEDHLYRAY